MTPSDDAANKFDELFAKVDNSGRWGAADERGTLNYITSAHVMAAVGCVRTGTVVHMGRAMEMRPSPELELPALHFMTRLAAYQHAEPGSNYDFVGYHCHSWNLTHVDALNHTTYRGRLYNGVVDRDAVGIDGSRTHSIEAMAGGIVGRGVFLDVARRQEVDWLEPGFIVTVDMLEEAEAAAGVTVREGDVVVYRTGHPERGRALGVWNPEEVVAGLHHECVQWLHDRRVAVLAGDGAHDVRPHVMTEVESPIHALTIVGMGMCTIDHLDLERLSAAAADRNQYEFLFAAMPLVIPRATGSPVNPLALL